VGLTAAGKPKEALLKKLQICNKIFDYRDETKDVKGKVRAAD